MEIGPSTSVPPVNSLIDRRSASATKHDGDNVPPRTRKRCSPARRRPTGDPCDACGKPHEPVRQARA